MIPRRSGALALLLAAVSPSVPAQEDVPGWTFGVASLPAVPSVDRHPALAQLPVLVIGRLADLEVRFPTEEEVRRSLERSRLAEVFLAGAAAASLRDRRDAAALSPSAPDERSAERRKLDEELRKTPDAAGTPGTVASPPATRPLRPWEGHAEGRLVAASADPAGACVREKLDYLLLWEVGEAAGYLRIRLYGWNAALGREDFSYTTYAPADDIPSAAEDLAQALCRAVVGRPSSRLVFDVDPPEARILVDGRRLTPGRRSLRVYEERDYSVSLEAGPADRKDYSLRSEFGRDVRLSARVEPEETGAVRIESDPPGASLYLDGIWAGTTPGEVKLFGAPRVARLYLPGYEEEFSVIRPEAGDLLKVSLREAAGAGPTEFDRSKERFYSALGRLAVSLPVTLLVYGLFLQSEALLREDPADASFASRRDITLAVFSVSGGITAGLLAGAVARLSNYIQSAR